ncbi:MAG: type II toxin-antitoxin system VapC family toxin [Chloroflexota bacterium]
MPSELVHPVDAMRVAIELGVGAYDATYLCLARARREPLLTLDRRLADAGMEGAIDVVWLGDS